MDTKQLRQKILDLAIRGKLVPQDPKDEPASVLLERVKAEKERLIAEGKIKRSKKSAASSDKPHYANWDLPRGWVRCNLIDICTVFSTGPFGSMVHKSDYIESRGIPLVNPMNIIDGCIVKEKIAMVSSQKAHELARYKLQENDILIARRGDLSKCAIVNKQSSGCLCGTGSFFLHVPFVEPQYIMLFYLSDYVQTILKRECVGATMENLNQGVLGNIPLLLPPIEEQKRIILKVKTLETIVFNIDSGSQEISRLTSQVKTKVLELAISGKLVPQDPADEPAADLLQRVNSNAVISADTSHYGQLPDGWCYTTMKFICHLYDGEKIEDKELINLDAKYLRGKSEGNTLNKGRFVPERTTLILVDGENSGEIFTAPINGYQGSTFKLLDINEEMNAEYVKMIIRIYQKRLRDNKVGSAIPHLNKKMFREILVPVPPIAEQTRIVGRTNELMSKITELSEAL